ncbi:MAG: uroporphyrinogen-III C-methyltransferase [Acidimicrobiales bacterium]|nr:uroporphyrinogen-III C-methyltransferase [Acidimicrobiales bacterium]
MTVYLVGAGPGDPGLLTVRGHDLLTRADVVVYDRLSVASLLELAPEDAERINVGKAPGQLTMPQEQINELLVERGRTAAVVVRLKGGDPFVFARGGEEAAALQAAGVPFEVVPGISSAVAVPAYAGIPVTMRHSSTSFTVITGHEDPDKGGELDWEAAARLGGTIVVLMGVRRLPRIVARLLAGGLAPDTPAAAIRWGTRPEQHTVRATLATLADHDLASPSTIVIGAVAALDLAWFERRALFGRRVVVTRARDQASALADRLRDAGADVVEVPTIRIAPPSDGGAALADAAARLGSYDWVVVTSPNGASRLLEAVGDARRFGSARIAAIGPATARVLADRSLVADLVPGRFVAEELLAAFPAPPRPGARVLLARAAVARDVLPDGLRDRGWAVDVVEAYRTEPAPLDDARRAAVRSADVITFTSSSTVENAVAALGVDALPPVVACIGPVTARTARAHGLHVAVEADRHTVPGLVDALVAWAADHRPEG